MFLCLIGVGKVNGTCLPWTGGPRRGQTSPDPEITRIMATLTLRFVLAGVSHPESCEAWLQASSCRYPIRPGIYRVDGGGKTRIRILSSSTTEK